MSKGQGHLRRWQIKESEQLWVCFKVFLVYAGLFFADSLELSLLHFLAFLSLHTAALGLHDHGLLIQKCSFVPFWSFLPDSSLSNSIRFFRIYSLCPSYLVPLKPMTIWSKPSWTSQMTHVYTHMILPKESRGASSKQVLRHRRADSKIHEALLRCFSTNSIGGQCLVEFADNLRYPLAFSWTSWRSRSVFPDRCMCKKILDFESLRAV